MAAILLKSTAKILLAHVLEYTQYELHKFSQPYMAAYYVGINRTLRLLARAFRLRKIVALYKAYFTAVKSFFSQPKVQHYVRELSPGMLVYKLITRAPRATEGARVVAGQVSAVLGQYTLVFLSKLISVLRWVSAAVRRWTLR